MIKRQVLDLHPSNFVAPQNFAVNEVLIGDVIRETKRHCDGRALTPVLAHYEAGRYTIVGNIAAYLVAVQLKIETVPTMRVDHDGD